MYTIREGIKEDCIGINALIKELAVYEKMPNGPQLDTKRLEEDGFGDGPDGRLFRTFVAELNDSKQIIGYVLYFYRYSTWTGKYVWMEDLYVQPQYRKYGIGSALFKTVVKHAANLSSDRMEWNCLDWNQSSITFYKKFGAIDLTQTEGWHTFRLERQLIEQLSKSDQ